MEDRNKEQWEKVFSTNAVYQAEILKALLEEENIVSIVVNKQDSSYLSFGEVEVYVKSEDLLKAKQLSTNLSRDE
jgi:Putative prokaryotic signal transducing protein